MGHLMATWNQSWSPLSKVGPSAPMPLKRRIPRTPLESCMERTRVMALSPLITTAARLSNGRRGVNPLLISPHRRPRLAPPLLYLL